MNRRSFLAALICAPAAARIGEATAYANINSSAGMTSWHVVEQFSPLWELSPWTLQDVEALRGGVREVAGLSVVVEDAGC